MPEWVAVIPQLAGIIEKGGVIGMLLIVAVAIGWRLSRKERELNRVYAQRDFCRQVSARYKVLLDSHGIKVDITDLEQQRKEDEHDGKD